MYLQNKYSKWYNNIINKAASRKLPGGTYKERHHIIPRCLGGDNSKSNLVDLTAREHFICHWLLTKMVVAEQQKLVWFALFAMGTGHKKQHRYATQITSRVYSRLKEIRSAIVSEQLTGRPVSVETRNKIRDAQLGIKRKPHSEETKAKMRAAAKHRKPDSEETRLKKSLARKGKPSPLKGRSLPEEVKAKLRKPKPPRTEQHKQNLRKVNQA